MNTPEILTDRDRLSSCTVSMGRTWGALRLLQLYHPEHPLKPQLDEVIKSLEADVTRLFYPDALKTSEHS